MPFTDLHTVSNDDMQRDRLRIATRQSPLALWQAEHIQGRLQDRFPQLDVELVTFVTQGDKILDTPLAKIGGKGLFVKELEAALLDGRADLAVHSMKDVPMQLPEGLVLAVSCAREDPFDAFVSNRYSHIDQLPHGAVVGTSSLRRRCQLLAARPDLNIKDLRGNVGTRLSKLDDGQYDAIVLAAAGLKRLNLEQRITHTLDPALSLPAVGQGVLGLECRAHDHRVFSYVQFLQDELTDACITAERAFNAHLEGGCQVPIAAFAQVHDQQLHFEGRVGSLDGKILLRSTGQGALQHAQQIGIEVAEELLRQGAGPLLQHLSLSSLT